MEQQSQHEALRDFLITIGEAVCDSCQRILLCQDVSERTRIHARGESDVIYAIDNEAEAVIVGMLESEAARFDGIVMVAEGIGETEVTVYPHGMPMEKARWRILVDPIDGTRGLMYDKRPAFFLAGVAPNTGAHARLSDIEVAVMVEISTTRMHVSDTFHAIRGRGAHGYRRNLLDGLKASIVPQPSTCSSIRGGFAQISRFFPSGKDFLAMIEEELITALFPDASEGEVLTFEDQYISSGGQLYEMLTGKDRFVADLRPAMFRKLTGQVRSSLTCHPYDLAAHLIGTEAGLLITDVNGHALDGPMDTLTPMDWIGFANTHIHAEVWPVLRKLLQKHGLLEQGR